MSKSIQFTISPKPVVTKADLSGEANWKLLKATGTYFAQLKVKCTSGYSAGISNLRIGFADRTSSGKAVAQLWDSTKRSAVATTCTHEGTVYRVVSLPATAIAGENVDVTYGVSSISGSTVPVAERTIEMYVAKRDLASHLDEYKTCIIWESNGVTYIAPVTNKSVR